MGNDISGEKDVSLSKNKKAGGGLRRSNSLKEQQTKPINNPSSPKEKNQNKVSIKRSHTFSPSSMKRPNLSFKFDNSAKTNKPLTKINRTDNRVDNIDLNGNKNLEIRIKSSYENICPVENQQFTNNIITEEEIADFDKDVVDSKMIQEILEIDETLIKTTHNKEMKEILNTEGNESEDNTVSNEISFDVEKIVLSENIEKTDNFEISYQDINEPLLEETRVEDIAFSNLNSIERLDDELIKTESNLQTVEMSPIINNETVISDGNITLRSDNDTHQNSDELNNISEQKLISSNNNFLRRNKHLELPLPGEEKKRSITRRKNKYIRRSQSMKSYHELLPQLLSGEGFASISELSKAAEEHAEQEILLQKQKLRRRTSDTCLLKEHHIKRSEQFTYMLNEIREKAMRDMKPLSPYAKEFISETFNKDKNKVKPERKFKFEKNHDYFNFWLKDHNERIDNLTKACKGDLEISRLRKSFNEGVFLLPSKTLLPQRPHSVKLPRKKLSSPTFSLSSDSSDNEGTYSDSISKNSKPMFLMGSFENSDDSIIDNKNNDAGNDSAIMKSNDNINNDEDIRGYNNSIEKEIDNIVPSETKSISRSHEYIKSNTDNVVKRTICVTKSSENIRKTNDDQRKTKIKIRSRKAESMIFIKSSNEKIFSESSTGLSRRDSKISIVKRGEKELKDDNNNNESINKVSCKSN